MAISEPKSAHLREVLLFAFNWKKSATEAHRMLEEVYSDHALSKSQCYRWFKKFQSGDFELDNEPHGKPPQKFEDAELQALLDEDSTQMQEKLAKQLQVSQGDVDKSGSTTEDATSGRQRSTKGNNRTGGQSNCQNGCRSTGIHVIYHPTCDRHTSVQNGHQQATERAESKSSSTVTMPTPRTRAPTSPTTVVSGAINLELR
ncbi:hypothetical protein LAZ67_6000885 [Cordylochernes scorpioides]|uniref:Mos1 transposase HTH domain-containing protein n=1 Tax=Cordylochernes scorpioides TaxID=51811 RepID=A0ABY6KIY1_9ARAC|nr:hypothetical protein LAZ67_6000885 [Cordylochernes scorpioides]